MVLSVLKNKELLKNKTLEIISEAMILYTSKLSNFPITIKAIT